MTKRGLRILIIEDSAEDFDLLVREVKQGGWRPAAERVETLEQVDAALEPTQWDVILCDYILEGFTALEVLALYRDKGLDVPFIVVSSSVGEEIAVGAMRAGAHDYIMKANLTRLAPSIEREVREARLRLAHRQAEEALHQSEERVRLLLDASAEAIYGLDLEGNCTFSNQMCLQLLGYSDPGQLMGQNMHALIHHTRTDGTPYPEHDCLIHRNPRPEEPVHVDDEVFWRADGSSFPAEYWAHPVWRQGVLVGRVVTFLDITERRHLERQVRQSQKLEAIGRLAGGVAHDFNNLLTVITGYGRLLLDRLPQTAPEREQTQEIVRAAERAAALTSQLLAFSRRQVIQPRVFDLNEHIAHLDRMLRRVIGEDIDLVLSLSPDLERVKADPGQIEQVLMNLAVNSRDAMPKGGRLAIETASVDVEAAEQDVPPGRYVLLAVSDSGCGMDASVLARAFEPFFTTKEQGKGTGLGLSTVYGIVEQSGGHILVDSQPGKGTTVRIYLPATKQPVQSFETALRDARWPQDTETILLVEDDDGVRALTRSVLQQQGYHVLEAGSPRDALEVSEGWGKPVHLLLTDVVMPGMRGDELGRTLAFRWPEMRVIYTSGYAEGALASNGRLPEGMIFLSKPFTPANLVRLVREVLDGPPSVAAHA